MTPFRSTLTRSVAMAAAWLVLLMVGLGLSRRLVVCNQPCCAGHVKVFASCDAAGAEGDHADAGTKPGAGCSCCSHRHDRRHGGQGEHGDRAEASGACCHGCVHVALGVDLGLPPGDGVAFDSVALPVGPVTQLPVWADATPVAVAHPPATGPPRCDRRTALLATTVLRL